MQRKQWQKMSTPEDKCGCFILFGFLWNHNNLPWVMLNHLIPKELNNINNTIFLLVQSFYYIVLVQPFSNITHWKYTCFFSLYCEWYPERNNLKKYIHFFQMFRIKGQQKRDAQIPGYRQNRHLVYDLENILKITSDYSRVWMTQLTPHFQHEYRNNNRQIIQLEFSLTCSCVSLTRSITSSEWKLFRLTKWRSIIFKFCWLITWLFYL